MSDDEDGGERTNAEYYSAYWTKPIKPRTAAKRVKPKRVSKKAMGFGDLAVGLVEHLRRLHHKRIHTRKGPLLRGKFPRERH